MDAWIYFLGVGAGVGLVSALLAWLLQLRKRGRHPAVSALLASILLAVITVLGAGIVVVRALIAIGKAGHADIDQAAPAMSLFIQGGLVIMLIPLVGFPAALVAASWARRSAKD